MSSVQKKSGVSLPSREKPDVDTKDDKGTKEKKMTTIATGNIVKKENQVAEKTSSLSKTKDTKAEKNVPSQGSSKTPSHDSKPSSVANSTSTNVSVSTGGLKAAAATSKTKSSGTAVPTAMSNEAKPASTPTAMQIPMPATKELAASGSTAPGTSKRTSDPKVDAIATTTLAKKEKTEIPVKKPIGTTTTPVAAVAQKQSQQHSHSKPHTQQQQHNRYFIPSRQNQEEAVFKMVQNVFKLLETRGPLTMAQLEYNLPILILGSSPSISMSSQTVTATASKTTPAVPRDPSTGDSSKDGSNIVKKQNTEAKPSNNRTSLCEEKLIPGNMVPDIVELLVTLGLIQEQADVDDTSSSGGAMLSVPSSAETDLSNTPQQRQQAASTKNQLRKQPRFAVHFGKPKQFLVTPTNILSEIAKAQTEIQLSRQRQESLKEALGMADQQAAERVKHIVLQHPQVVDDPVYVTALRNLQVDEMLMAGTSGASTTGNANASASSTIKDGPGKPKSGVGGGGKKVGGGKRRQSAGSTPAKRKRQKSKKDTLVRTSGDVDSTAGKKAIAPSGSIGVGSKQTTAGGSLPSTEGSKQVSSAKAVSVSSTAPLSTQPVATVASASAILSKTI